MLIDLNNLDLVKGITRSEAKAVHKDLPPGGAWRTIKGHHIYIKDGKVLAGSIPGVTKAKKASKAQLTTHQATIDGEAKKGTKKDGGKTSAQKTTTGKASKQAGAKSGSNTTGKTAKKASKGTGTADKGVTKEKANGTKTVGAKTNGTPKTSVKKPTTKPNGTGKSVSTNGAKKGASEGGTQNVPAAKEGVIPHETFIRKLARQADDGMDMFAAASESTESMTKLREAMLAAPGEKAKDKLDYLHKNFGGGVSSKRADTRNPLDYQLGDDRYSDASYQLINDDKLDATGRAQGKTIRLNPDIYKVGNEEMLQHTLHHELGHTLTERFPGLEAHIMSNPSNIFGTNNSKEMRFEAALKNLKYGGSKWKATPEEVWADSYALFQTNPDELKKQSPQLYSFVQNVVSRIPGHMQEINRIRELFHMGRPDKPKEAADEPTSEEHFEVYHGTKLPNVADIKKDGFRMNGNEADFGNAAYFKSPSFDEKDHDDWKSWLDSRRKKGAPIPSGYESRRGNDTAKIVSGFAGKGSIGAVIKAVIPKKHVLDCSKGRPKELQQIIDEFGKAAGGSPRIKLAFKHILGENIDHMTPEQVGEEYQRRKAELATKWGGGKFIVGAISPYEVYAKKTGVKAIVDKLDDYTDEGWQIGVYDPKIIQIKDHGRGIEHSNGVKLLKALLKALSKGKSLPYCLLHHEIDGEGLHLYVGALKGDTMQKGIYIDLEKAITRTQAKAVHKDLPPGGEWRTIKGHHIYIKDGKVLAGAIPGVSKAKKATKAQLAEHQTTIDKEKKGTKKNAKKVPEKPTKAPKGKGNSGTAKPKSTAKPAPAKPSTPAKKSSGAKKVVAPKTKAPAKKAKDIRTEAQKNRELAYDVGDKVGGARKDDFVATFKEKPTQQSLADLEKMSGAVAEKMVTKANLLPKHDFETEHKNGIDLPTAILKKLIFDRIAPKPEPSTPETRKEYMNAMNKVYRHFAGIKSFENMIGAVRELSQMARKAKRHDEALEKLDNKSRYSYLNEELMNQYITEGKDAKKFMDFNALGDKFHNFLTNYESTNRTIETVRKNTKEGWEKYLNPQAKNAPKKERGAENKRWERKAEAEHLRKGGKETKVKKPEDLMKEFNLRGVEFGHWVNDSSGLYHLKRSAEAFDDLADIIGVDKQDISLNGRLAIAFGARGNGTAVAHYEPDRKVINLTKFGGAGSLAHEWGHAMDNILYQYSNGGQESLGHASDGNMGNHDPKLNALYDNLMEAITKPAPGEKGANTQMILDSSVKSLSRYYPEMRRQVNDGMKPEDVFHHWASKINSEYDRYIASVKANRMGFYKTQADTDKAIKKYEGERSRKLKDIGHYLAHELRLKQNGGKYGGDHYKGHIEIPTGNSEYLQRMIETQPGKTQNGAHYWSQHPELFARVFESYVQHTMDEKKRYNNYLVHGTREGNVKAEGAPFPIGKERTHMFKAMKNLLDYVSKKGTLKKALLLEILASGHGDMTEELNKALFNVEDLRKLGIAHRQSVEAGRNAYRIDWTQVDPNDEIIYIPLNRLQTPHQTEKATNWDKVSSNFEKMDRGEGLAPIVIGHDYEILDGHHRWEASKEYDFTHIPCVVMKGTNDIDRKRAIEAYQEVWKSFTWDDMLGYFKDKLNDGESIDGAYEETINAFDRDWGEEVDFRAILKKHGYKVQDHFWVNKSIQPDPVAPAPFEDGTCMFRGVGQKELDYIFKNKRIQSKGKGNDDDKGVDTCFSNLFRQAEGYARSNYDLYDEKHAYVLVVRKPEWIVEDEHGELISDRAVPYHYIENIVYIPKPE